MPRRARDAVGPVPSEREQLGALAHGVADVVERVRNLGEVIAQDFTELREAITEVLEEHEKTLQLLHDRIDDLEHVLVDETPDGRFPREPPAMREARLRRQ